MLKKNKIAILLILIVIATGFIFSNSTKNSEESHEASGAIVELVEPVLEGVMDTDALSFIVRKCAHIAEFSVLGFLVLSAAVEVKKKLPSCVGYGLFYVLLVAVTDEFIQSFFNRTSSVRDIFIDFLGALLGFALCLSVNYCFEKLRQLLLRKTKKGTDDGYEN